MGKDLILMRRPSCDVKENGTFYSCGAKWLECMWMAGLARRGICWLDVLRDFVLF